MKLGQNKYSHYKIEFTTNLTGLFCVSCLVSKRFFLSHNKLFTDLWFKVYWLKQTD